MFRSWRQDFPAKPTTSDSDSTAILEINLLSRLAARREFIAMAQLVRADIERGHKPRERVM